MRALRQTSLGGPKDMRLVTDALVPTPGPAQVLIRVVVAGVNYADVMQAHGSYDGGPRAPYLAGFEAAGVVVAVGASVAGIDIGDHVLGTGYGAFAEYMALSADAVVPVPANWTDEQALGLVLNSATALAALKPLGRVARGETVVIHAAAGGVGQAAIRMAKHYGSTVIAVAAADKHGRVRSLGADHAIDSRHRDIAGEVVGLTDGVGADLVLGSVGGPAFSASLAMTRRITGRLIVYGVAGGEAAVTNWELNFKHQVHLIGLHIGVLMGSAPALFRRLWDDLLGLVATGVVPPGEPTVYDLADGPQALARLAARSTVGKLALRP